MTTYRQFCLIIPIILASACGGSGKASETPAASGDTAAKTEAAKPESTDVTTKSESAKPKAEAAAAEDPGPACKKDKDCMIFSDCCTCNAVLAAGKPPVPCDAVCGESKCELKGKTQDNVACVEGHCKVK